jgi:hypothetical protein
MMNQCFSSQSILRIGFEVIIAIQSRSASDTVQLLRARRDHQSMQQTRKSNTLQSHNNYIGHDDDLKKVPLEYYARALGVVAPREPNQ